MLEAAIMDACINKSPFGQMSHATSEQGFYKVCTWWKMHISTSIIIGINICMIATNWVFHMLLLDIQFTIIYIYWVLSLQKHMRQLNTQKVPANPTTVSLQRQKQRSYTNSMTCCWALAMAPSPLNQTCQAKLSEFQMKWLHLQKTWVTSSQLFLDSPFTQHALVNCHIQHLLM